MKKDANYWMQKLKLEEHPEGGYFRETYRSLGLIPSQALPGKFPGERNFSTAIYYLLRDGEFSTFHRLKTDELWHFYAGDQLHLYVLGDNGKLDVKVLGKEPEQGQQLQALVEQGNWFAARVEVKGGYALVGCTLAPGFDFDDLEIAERKALLEAYPQHKQLIKELTRE